MTRNEAPSFSRRGPRRRIGQEGQILMMFLIFLVPMTMIVFTVYNVGTAVSEKIKVQTAADNAAYSAAVWEARYMNLTAYINRAMIANYDALATLITMWSMMDSLEGFVFAAQFVTQFIPIIGPAISGALRAVHEVVNPINTALARAVGSNAQGRNVGFGRYIEIYNKVLSTAQQGLYVLNQLGRQSVIAEIGSGVDRFVEYDNFAEIINTLNLDKRRKWAATPANIGTGADRESALQLATARSLNNFADGRSIRDGLTGLLPGVQLYVDLFFCDFGITQLGPYGFDGDDYSPFTGGDFDNIDGTKNGCDRDPKGDCKTKIVRNEKIYELDSFGLTIDFCVTDITIAHHSDDAKNSLPFLHITDTDHTGSNYVRSHFNNFRDNGINCNPAQLGGSIPSIGGLGGAQQASQECAQIRQQNQQRQAQNAANPQCAQQFQNCLPMLDEETTFQGQTRDCDDIDDLIEDQADAFNNQMNQSMGQSCAAEYNFSNGEKLTDVKVTTYVQNASVVDGRRVEGPTIFVYFRKPAARLPIFRGLGLQGNERDFEAYSFAKVYYAQRVGDRTDGPSSNAAGRKTAGSNAQSNQESMFNPFWAPRLERPSFPLIGEILH